MALNVFAAAIRSASSALRFDTVGSSPRWTFSNAAAASARASASVVPLERVSFFGLPATRNLTA